MLRLIFSLIKLVFFSIAVLILGNSIYWKGRTVSDQVKFQMSHAEEVPFLNELQRLSSQFYHDAKKGFSNQLRTHPGPRSRAEPDQDEFSTSERKKLRHLMNELSHTNQSDN